MTLSYLLYVIYRMKAMIEGLLFIRLYAMLDWSWGSSMNITWRSHSHVTNIDYDHFDQYNTKDYFFGPALYVTDYEIKWLKSDLGVYYN